MATTLFLRDMASSLGGAGQKAMLARRGRAAVTTTTTTVASGTNIQITATAGGQALEWFSEPITKAFSTTAGSSINYNIRVRESANAVNAGVAILVERTDSAGTVLSTLLTRAVVGVEATTTESARLASRTPTITSFAVGDRIKVTLSVINVGTMGAGTFNTYHDGPAAAASGDSYILFTNDDFVTDEIIEVGASEIAGAGIYG